MVDALLDSSASSNAICTCSSYSWSLRPFSKGNVILLECEAACLFVGQQLTYGLPASRLRSF